MPPPIYHLSVKVFSRAKGESAVGASAYRAGVLMKDERTGQRFDWRHRIRNGEVLSSEIVYDLALVPDDFKNDEGEIDRAVLWNRAEAAENRKNSCVAREIRIHLPSELSADDRDLAAHEMGRYISAQYQVPVEVSIHAPDKSGDARNFHAHLLIPTRRLAEHGFGEKTRELDSRETGSLEVRAMREVWAEIQNTLFAKAGLDMSVSEKSYVDQGVDKIPTKHMGAKATAIERILKKPTRIGDYNRRIISLNDSKDEAKAELEQALDALQKFDDIAQAEIDNSLSYLEELRADLAEAEAELEKALSEAQKSREEAARDAVAKETAAKKAAEAKPELVSPPDSPWPPLSETEKSAAEKWFIAHWRNHYTGLKQSGKNINMDDIDFRVAVRFKVLGHSQVAALHAMATCGLLLRVEAFGVDTLTPSPSGYLQQCQAAVSKANRVKFNDREKEAHLKLVWQDIEDRVDISEAKKAYESLYPAEQAKRLDPGAGQKNWNSDEVLLFDRGGQEWIDIEITRKLKIDGHSRKAVQAALAAIVPKVWISAKYPLKFKTFQAYAAEIAAKIYGDIETSQTQQEKPKGPSL